MQGIAFNLSLNDPFFSFKNLRVFTLDLGGDTYLTKFRAPSNRLPSLESVVVSSFAQVCVRLLVVSDVILMVPMTDSTS